MSFKKSAAAAAAAGVPDASLRLKGFCCTSFLLRGVGGWGSFHILFHYPYPTYNLDMGVVLKPLFCFFISRVRSTGFRDQFLDARKRGERSAKGFHTYLIMSRPIMKDETKTRLRKSKF